MTLNSQTKSLFKMAGPLISNDHKFNEDAFITSQYTHELLPKVLEVIEKYKVKDKKAIKLLHKCNTFINSLKKEASLLDF